ncbi:hypothetical protein ACFQ67_03480 [Streptomyces sp. NPDC056488]|uniref:hypothetical protein n=1 Tax=unclassified Streptomyces TaxID=2593676 RepID=UPI0036A6C607
MQAPLVGLPAITRPVAQWPTRWATADDRRVRAVMDDALVHRVIAYVRRHLTDPELSPDRIAHAHAFSRRRLYAVLKRVGIRLEQWVIAE